MTMKSKPLPLLASFLSLLLFTACESTPKVESVLGEGTDWSQYNTFAFKVTEAELSSLVISNGGWIEDAVEIQMLAKNYQLSTNDAPHLLVTIEREVKTVAKKSNFSFGVGVGSYSGGRSGGSGGSVGVNSGPIGGTSKQVGVLIIRLLDAKTNSLVWVGWMDEIQSGVLNQNELSIVVSDIMATVPNR